MTTLNTDLGEHEDRRASIAKSAARVSVSVVIEWDNAARIGDERARLMFLELGRQLAALAEPFELSEIVFTCADKEREAPAIEAIVSATRLAVPWCAVQAPDPSYAGQKFYGAALSQGEIIVMLDSDVVPQSGWLIGLLAPFLDEEASVVCGETFVAPRGLYGAAMALAWLFPLRSGGSGLAEVPTFHANNFAIRRDVLEELAVQPTQGHRDGTMQMVADIVASGHRVLLNRAAAVEHPPPDGLLPFVKRAVWSGVDNALIWQRRHAPMRGLMQMALDLIGSWGRVRRGFREVGIGPVGAIAAGAILTAYYLIRLTSFLTSLMTTPRKRRGRFGPALSSRPP